MSLPLPALIAAGAAACYLIYRVHRRLQLSLAKHPSIRGHAKWSRRLAKLVPYYSLSGDDLFGCDGAPAEVMRLRCAAMERLTDTLKAQSRKTLAQTRGMDQTLSDVAFTNAYRVPFPFRAAIPDVFRQPSMVVSSSGVELTDLDGNHRIDLSGSYGVNVFGYDFYKSCIDEACDLARPLGPVLGPYHPIVKDNAERLAVIAGLDEVSFHMSGTEAVMQAVRLARYATGRSHLVRFCGSYHGWWDGVQPGVGNERQVNDVYTLTEMSKRSLQVIATRTDIACVLVNPLQALNPNRDAPTDGGLLSSKRSAHFDRAAYSEWLRELRRTCNEAGVVLIFDEVLTGFRLDSCGAQGYFGIQADMVTYGKTLGGGLPIGALAGRSELMRRFDPERPARVSLARGTFNCHPYVMAAMKVFLDRIELPEVREIYRKADTTWERRRGELNQALKANGLPVRFEGMHSIWTTIYLQPSRFNWMFQFYCRSHGLELAWIGSGRLIFSLDMTDFDFQQVKQALLLAARDMQADGWWWGAGVLTAKDISRQLVREMLAARFPWLPKPKHSLEYQPRGIAAATREAPQ